jgi:hypothetical protein
MSHRSARDAARALTTRITAAAVIGAGLLVASCSQDPTPPPLRSLDRPSSLAFGCYGDMRLIEEGEAPGVDHEIVRTAQPLSSCQLRARNIVPPGQESLEGYEVSPPELFAFALQRARGTVAVIDAQSRRVRDTDRLTPGTSSIPIGTLPVDIQADASGCFLATANAGSCDLSYLDVGSAVDQRRRAEVHRLPVVSATGERLRAKPSAIVAQPQAGDIGRACPEEPEGLVYIAYPQCNLVAAVELATGEVVAGLRFDADGELELTDGEVSCQTECSAGSITPTLAELASTFNAGGPPRPVALHLTGNELLIGSDNSPRVQRVVLDEDGMPLGALELVLQGDVGVLELEVSPVINMGGDRGELGGTGVEAQFLYAVATDRTVRVVDLFRQVECDTQVDHRLIYDVRDMSTLSCMPVGSPSTPARREGARSPGIHLPRGEVPLDVAFATLGTPQPAPPSPVRMVGNFAFITATSGVTYVVNVDDDAYPDFESVENPRSTFLQLALPHTLRDLVPRREEEPTSCQELAGDAFQLPPRLQGEVIRGFRPDRLSVEHAHLLPKLRSVACELQDDGPPVSELSYLADTQTRELAFPDLGRVRNDRWTVSWEGRIPGRRDSPGSVLAAELRHDGGEVAIRDGAARFCSLGAEPFDIAEIRGCNPAERGVCGIGKECFIHPDQPTEVARGLCVPSDRIGQFADACGEVMATHKRYTIEETYADRLVIGERRRVLGSSPIAGCESDQQCGELADYEVRVRAGDHPIEAGEGEGAEYDWVCAPDPSRAEGLDRCQISCLTSDDCEPGTACSGGFCVEGLVPPAECTAGIERFELRVGDAFAVVGEQEGFLHGRLADPETGECIDDPDAHPLATGRIPLDVPGCESDAIDALSPNPCHTTIDTVEVHREFEVDGDECIGGDSVQRVREAPAIRFRNPIFTFHLVDHETQGDLQCRGDRLGELPVHASTYAVPELTFQIVGGFVPMFAVSEENVTYARRIVRGPLGRMWVLDEGEQSDALRGQVIVFDPGDAPNRFSLRPIQ